MSPADILDVARDGILTVILVSAPMMLVGLIVGVIVSLIQALTQIQEQTLVFVPKILAIFGHHAGGTALHGRPDERRQPRGSWRKWSPAGESALIGRPRGPPVAGTLQEGETP